ncbi:MAG TPA: 2-oxoacid:acceptor oxidoreductase subunit alpha [Candidatus Nanoarchaeia archaeon]|nr:2-oxoacid:acceptor oxidoreductase subunit alpha [Candidatus Nanoarchaeia archaeon]
MEFTWMIGGEAGFGIMASGLTISKAFARGGLHVFDNVEYPSLIRGGHNSYQVRVSDREVFSHTRYNDILVALNEETIHLHKEDMAPAGCILFNGKKEPEDRFGVHPDICLFPIPLSEIIQNLGVKSIMQNTAALGATIALIGYDLTILEDLLKEMFQRKGDQIVQSNIKVAKAGYDFAMENHPGGTGIIIKPIDNHRRLVITGNEAVGLGALSAGLRFYSAYPMTPASGLLHFLAAEEHNHNLVVKHTEDELAAILMAIGASHAGVRSMTASSGGGFALMAESLGMAAMTETPLVVMVAQRPGPSTGLATHTEQGDLRFVMHASQGDFLRVVIAPGDVNECYQAAGRALNLAEKFQIPVIIITDKYLTESHKTAEPFDPIPVDRGLLLNSAEMEIMSDYKRFELTESGISPRVIPGHPNSIFTANSNEHDEYGHDFEDPDNRTAMMDKRMKKIECIIEEIEEPTIHGPPMADVTLVGWGSTKGPILEAMILLAQNNINVNFLQIIFIHPFPSEKVAEILTSARLTIDVENNKEAQLAGVIRERTGIEMDEKILKYNGQQFTPEEIANKVMEVLQHG